MGITSLRLGEILPTVLRHIGRKYEKRADLIIAAWPEIIGAHLSSMTEAVLFEEGLLYVKVNNSTLHSVLNQVYRARIVRSLRDKFPGTEIKNVIFRIG